MPGASGVGVLVTGVGYIGARLVADLLSEGADVVGIDNLSSTSSAQVRWLQSLPGFRFVRGSILNRSVLQDAFGALASVDCVYHLAAQASASPQAATPRYTENSNLLGSRLVFEEAVRAGARRVVFGSSLRVYGPRLEGVVTERSPYGVFQDLSHLSKCYVEKLLEMTAHQTGIPSVSVRLAITYGLAPVMKSDYRYMTAPNKFCLQAVRGETIALHPSAVGKMGFIHVEDASASLRLAARMPLRAPYAAANAVSELLSVAHVADAVKGQAEQRGLAFDVEGLASSSASSEVAVESALSAAGFEPRRTMSESLGEVLDYFAKRERARRR
jgi:nucleoside-diphosphate-sugar epimerase